MIFNIFFELEKKYSDKIKNIFSEEDFQKIFSEVQDFLPKDKKNFSIDSGNFGGEKFFEDKEINLFFVSDDEIQKLNKEFRNKNKLTDCLSFEKTDEDKKSPFDPVFGECFVAMPYIQKQAEEYGVSLKYEITKMIIHSILHLYGYDHIEDCDYKDMSFLEKNIIKKLKEEDFV